MCSSPNGRLTMPGSWRRRFTGTLGLRVAIWYAGVFLVSTTTIGLLAYFTLATSLERRDHDLLLVKLAEYASRYESGGVPAVSRIVSSEQASGGPDSVLVRLVGANADVLLVSEPPTWNAFATDRLNPAAGAGDDWQQVPSRIDAATLEVVSRPLFDGVIMQVGRTTIGRDRFLAQVREVMSLMVVVVLAAGLLGGVALTASALKPLRELRNTVRSVTRTGQLDVRVTTDEDGDLVNELGHVFNAMLARIEALVAGMRGALDNVAHDLRTPIARLRARAESALTSTSGEAACRDALAACIEEADRVIALLTTLMDISEAETGTMRLTLETVPVQDVVSDAIDLYEDTAEDRGVTLSSTAPAALFVRADRQRLRQMLANLIDNALKYTPAGGRVVIGAERVQDEDEVAVTIADTGSGIDARDLPRIWDRLYRGDAARGEPGLGLGLSLVRAIATAHGGRAEVSSEIGKGATFRITLPAVGA
jgi:signal transduction histidine kinase